MISQVDLVIEREAGDILLGWNDGGELQTSTDLAEWETMLNTPSPLRLVREEQLDSQFFRVVSTWSTRAELLDANSEMSVAELNGKIYVLGGYPSSRISVATVQIYDPETDVWSYGTSLPQALNHTMAASVAGKIYLIGGQVTANGVGPFVNTVYAYDPESNEWSVKAPMPTIRSGCNGITANGCFYVFGGEGDDSATHGVFEEVEVYNPKTDSWTQLEPFPIPVHGVTGAAFIDGLIYLPGGGVSEGGSSGGTQHQVFHVSLECL